MNTISFHHEFEDFIKKSLSFNRNSDKAKDKNICLTERCKNIIEGERNK